MYVPSDADKSVGQSAGGALLLWLRRGVVAEHSLNVETQHKTQETARLTVLIETHEGQITAALTLLYYILILLCRACSSPWLRAEKCYKFETENEDRKNITSTTW